MAARFISAFTVVLFLGVAQHVHAQDATEASPPPPANVQLTVELVDGSKIIGPPISLAELPLKVDFGEVKLPLALLQHLSFTKDRASLIVKFKNGDQLTGALLLKQIKIKTAFGEATIPIERIGKISITPK